jgi:hypothetical protein
MMFVPVELPQRPEKKEHGKLKHRVETTSPMPEAEVEEANARPAIEPPAILIEQVATNREVEVESVECPSCGRMAAKGAFCSHCGASLVPERRCPKCGAVVPAGKRFCTSDGTPIPD